MPKIYKRLHINQHYVPLEVLDIPMWVVNVLEIDDYDDPNLNDEDMKAIDKFLSKYIFWCAINGTEYSFEPYHDFTDYGILACDCTKCYCIDRKYKDRL